MSEPAWDSRPGGSLVTVARGTGRPARLFRFRGWRLAVTLGPVVTGWVFITGALVSAFGTPVWIVAAVGLEAAVGATLTALVLARSVTMAVWVAGAAAGTAGWVSYAAAAGPWSWPGELSLIVLAALFGFWWPAACTSEAGTSERSPAIRRLRQAILRGLRFALRD